MQIAIDASSWANDRGYGRVTRCLISALASRDQGFSYTLLFDSEPTYPVPDGVEVKFVRAGGSISETGGGTRYGRHARSMAKAARKMECDLFYFPTVYTYFPFLSAAPKLVGFHDTIPERFPGLIFPKRHNYWMWRAKTILARQQATRILTVSQASKSDLQAYLGISPDDIDVMTLAADPVFRQIDDPDVLKQTRSEHGVPEGARVLVYLGGFNRHKNVIRLIEAMPEIQASHPDVYLAIVGRFSGARFWDNVQELQDGARDNPRIGFVGEVDDIELAKLLNCAEALVFPSLWEGFGLPAIEAMACGTPVLASDRGSLPEVIGDCGLFFDPTDPSAIAKQTIRFLGDESISADLRTRSPRHAASFTWDRAAELAEASFRKTIERGR